MDPGAMGYLDGNDITPLHPDQGGQKAVHVIEEREVEKRGAVEYLQPAAGVGGLIPQEELAHRVGDSGGDDAPGRVVPFLPEPGYHAEVAVLAGENRLDHLRDVGRVVLAVAVHGGDQFAAGMPDSGSDRRALPVASGMLYHLQCRDRLLQPEQVLVGFVGARIVDHHDFAIEPGFEDFADEGADVFGFVVGRNYNRDICHSDGLSPLGEYVVTRKYIAKGLARALQKNDIFVIIRRSSF